MDGPKTALEPSVISFLLPTNPGGERKMSVLSIVLMWQALRTRQQMISSPTQFSVMYLTCIIRSSLEAYTLQQRNNGNGMMGVLLAIPTGHQTHWMEAMRTV